MNNIIYRIQKCNLIEKIEADKEYAMKLGVSNESQFRNQKINDEDARKKGECIL